MRMESTALWENCLVIAQLSMIVLLSTHAQNQNVATTVLVFLIVYLECGFFKGAGRCVRIMWNIEDMMGLIQRGQCCRW